MKGHRSVRCDSLNLAGVHPLPFQKWRVLDVLVRHGSGLVARFRERKLIRFGIDTMAEVLLPSPHIYQHIYQHQVPLFEFHSGARTLNCSRRTLQAMTHFIEDGSGG